MAAKLSPEQYRLLHAVAENRDTYIRQIGNLQPATVLIACNTRIGSTWDKPAREATLLALNSRRLVTINNWASPTPSVMVTELARELYPELFED